MEKVKQVPTKKSKKKSQKIMRARITLLILIVIVIAIIVGIVSFVSTKGKKPISADDFKNLMETDGYIVENSIEQFSDYDYVKDSCIAADKDLKYQLEFYVLENDEYALNFFNNNKSIFESSKSTASIETSADMKNCSRYTLNSNNKYMFLSRISNTVIYINVDSRYENDVKKIVEKLNY